MYRVRTVTYNVTYFQLRTKQWSGDGQNNPKGNPITMCRITIGRFRKYTILVYLILRSLLCV
ncbi:MAG: hypothetical protein DHS20C15_34970 [Planctomycetota bacterium]|nr:MAG: hypothetical protein DHS20C15_34970 [Planctomycetota bacterium]